MAPKNRKRAFEISAPARRDAHAKKRSKQTPREQTLFPFMRLPLELRWRVYDFHLQDFNRSYNQVHRLKEATEDREPIYCFEHFYRPVTLDDDFGCCSSRITRPMPLLQTKLRAEAYAYYLCSSLAVEQFTTECVMDMWLDDLSAVERTSVTKIYFIANFMTDVHMAGVFRNFNKPIIVLQLTNDGREMEIRSLWESVCGMDGWMRLSTIHDATSTRLDRYG